MERHELENQNPKSYRSGAGFVEIQAPVCESHTCNLKKKESVNSVPKQHHIMNSPSYNKMFSSSKFALWRCLIFLFVFSTQIMNN